MSVCLVSIDQSHSTFILTLQLRTPLVTAVLPMCRLCSLSPRLDSAPRNLIRFNDSQRNTSETVVPETRPAPLALCADTYHSCLRLNRFRPAPMNCSEMTPFKKSNTASSFLNETSSSGRPEGLMCSMHHCHEACSTCSLRRLCEAGFYFGMAVWASGGSCGGLVSILVQGVQGQWGKYNAKRAA